jgi:hypothetical protein
MLARWERYGRERERERERETARDIRFFYLIKCKDILDLMNKLTFAIFKFNFEE